MTRYYNNENYNAAFERCVDLMANLMIKHGPKILERQRQRMIEQFNNPDFQAAPSKDMTIHRLCGYCMRYRNLIPEETTGAA